MSSLAPALLSSSVIKDLEDCLRIPKPLPTRNAIFSVAIMSMGFFPVDVVLRPLCTRYNVARLMVYSALDVVINAYSAGILFIAAIVQLGLTSGKHRPLLYAASTSLSYSAKMTVVCASTFISFVKPEVSANLYNNLGLPRSVSRLNRLPFWGKIAIVATSAAISAAFMVVYPAGNWKVPQVSKTP